MCAGILNCVPRLAVDELFFAGLVVRAEDAALPPEPEREAALLAEPEARDLPPSIFDQVGGVDLAALGGDFFAVDDWAIYFTPLLLRIPPTCGTESAMD